MALQLRVPISICNNNYVEHKVAIPKRVSEILFRVRARADKSYRPLLTDEQKADANPKMIQLMTDCWAQEPEDRPTLNSVRERLENMIDAGQLVIST